MQAAGWQTWCIDTLMTEHDARLLSIAPWWRRSLRAGHSYAELGVLHGAAAGQRRRAVLWGGVLPLIVLFGAVVWWPLALGGAALWALSIMRQFRRFQAQGLGGRRAGQAAVLLMLSKSAEALGMASYWVARLRGRKRRLIEYK